MKSWSIDKKLFADFASIILTAVAMGVIALWAWSMLNRVLGLSARWPLVLDRAQRDYSTVL